MTITPEIVAEFKESMHLEGNEDAYLERILSASNKALLRACGEYDILVDEEFKELVFERSRYIYNDALEYFNENFKSEINTLAVGKALEEITLEGEADATV